MIRHILKKDWKLLRWYVIGLALMSLLSHLADAHLGGQLKPMVNSFSGLTLFATAILVIIIVQSDAIPGLRQDWLTRPVKRTDLLLSKLAFVVLLVQLPVFLIEVGEGLAAGFPLGQILGACLSRSTWVFLALGLPVFAFATLTRNLMEAVAASLAVGIAMVFFTTVSRTTHWGLHFDGTNGTPLVWIDDSLQVLWGLLCVGVIASIQYYGRKTITSRWLSGLAIVGWIMLGSALTWQSAFAVEQQFSPHSEAANSILISVDTSTPAPSYSVSARGNSMASIPLRIDGLRAEDMLIAEHISGRVRQQDGTVTQLWFPPPRPLSNGGKQNVVLPESLFSLVKDQLVRVELDYDLTLAKGDPAQAIPALNGDQWVEGVGTCTTTPDAIFGYAKLNCATMGEAPCATWFIGKPWTDLLQSKCNYSPWFNRVNGGSITHFGGDVYLSDITQSVKFPVSNAEVGQARVMIRIFHPQAHFTRHVVAPTIRLSDWSVEK